MPHLVFLFMLLFVGTSALLMGVSVPLLLGRVGRNSTYGVRTAETLADDQIWERGNIFGGRLLFVTGLVQLVAVIALYCVPFLHGNVIAYNGACGVFIVASLLAASAWIQRYVRTL